MKTEEMICELRRLEEAHKDDFVGTGETNWSLMCHDVANRLEELLKAQEARVLTYDELNRLHTDDVIWLEDIDKAEVIPAIVCGAPDYSSILDAVELCAYYRNKYISAITKDYLERWRCWTSRPTDEQREAAQWI